MNQALQKPSTASLPRPTLTDAADLLHALQRPAPDAEDASPKAGPGIDADFWQQQRAERRWPGTRSLPVRPARKRTPPER
jgi:hypothetical protein